MKLSHKDMDGIQGHGSRGNIHGENRVREEKRRGS